MRAYLIAIILIIVVSGVKTFAQVSEVKTPAYSATPQEPPARDNSVQRVEKLRAQLRDIQAQESEAQARLRQIEIELEPENIQRAISHIGSFKPEELREQRRLQLESERTKVRLQLEQITENRMKLEAAIPEAIAAGQRASAVPPPSEQAPSSAANENKKSIYTSSSVRPAELKAVSPARRRAARQTRKRMKLR
ncbi:MAG TPA: hypothetical protein VFD58_07310 [Blastocatellia bacterium]|nr:hypothetical protein [Blastocatellia bacterium]